MPEITSAADPRSPAFQANALHNRALAEQLRARTLETALGGPESADRRRT